MIKKLYLFTLGAALALGLTANAAVLDFTNDGNGEDDPFSFVNSGDPVTVFGWLDGERQSWNNNVGAPFLPEPTPFLYQWTDLNGVAPTIDVVTGDYIAIHYGTGPLGGMPGGGFVALYATADGQFTPPSSGSGPNGNGGISFVYLWDHVPNRVPDAGSTALLLGGALAGLALIRRKLAC